MAHVYSTDFKSATQKDGYSERSFYAFDVQSKSARTHQRLVMTGGRQILERSKHLESVTFTKILMILLQRFQPSYKQDKYRDPSMDDTIKHSK